MEPVLLGEVPSTAAQLHGKVVESTSNGQRQPSAPAKQGLCVEDHTQEATLEFVAIAVTCMIGIQVAYYRKQRSRRHSQKEALAKEHQTLLSSAQNANADFNNEETQQRQMESLGSAS